MKCELQKTKTVPISLQKRISPKCRAGLTLCLG